MAFKIGNISINHRPHCDVDGICLSCLEKAKEVPIKENFDDQFGRVEHWSTGSDCCGGEVAEGKIWLDETTTQVAKKNYFLNNKIIVKSGQKYRKHIRKGYYIDPNTEERKGIFEIRRWVPKEWH